VPGKKSGNSALSHLVIWKRRIKEKIFILSALKFHSHLFENLPGSFVQWNRDLLIDGGKGDSQQASEVGFLVFLLMCCHWTELS